jgi:hypothetical protein
MIEKNKRSVEFKNFVSISYGELRQLSIDKRIFSLYLSVVENDELPKDQTGFKKTHKIEYFRVNYSVPTCKRHIGERLV